MYSRFCKHGKPLCSKHYRQLEKNGFIKEQTIADRNKIIVHDTYAELITHNRDGSDNLYIKIDLDDIEKVRPYKWSMRGNYISSGHIDKERVRLHRFLVNAPNNMIVDHINHDVLDNRKVNLRICTASQNSMNRSGVVGVSKAWNKFRARIKIKGKQIELGNFDKFEDAVKAREKAEKKYFGKYAYKAG